MHFVSVSREAPAITKKQENGTIIMVWIRVGANFVNLQGHQLPAFIYVL